VAHQYGLAFIAMQEEHYDFVVPTSRLKRPAVQAFCALLDDPEVRNELASLGFRLPQKSQR
jgi:putative molybdopterin biosynthesis protein